MRSHQYLEAALNPVERGERVVARSGKSVGRTTGGMRPCQLESAKGWRIL